MKQYFIKKLLTFLNNKTQGSESWVSIVETIPVLKVDM